MADNVETVIQDLSHKNIKAASEHMEQLQADAAIGSDKWKNNMAAINERIDVKHLGLQGAGQLLGTDGLGNLLTLTEDKKELQHWKPDGQLAATRVLQTNYLRSLSTDIDKQVQEDGLSKLGPGDHHLTLVVEGKTRDFDVHVPKGYDGSKPFPAVFLLSGANPSTHGLMAAETRANTIGDQENFIAVYPYMLDKPLKSPLWLSASMQAYNSPTAGISDYVPGYNDNTYMKAVDQAVSAKLNMDPGRKYLFGFSDGGSAANDIPAQMPGTFAAIGSNHGTVWGGEKNAKDAGKTAYWGVVSDEGSWIPRLGGTGTFTSGLSRMLTSEPLKQFDNWGKADECHGSPQVHENEKEIVRQFSAAQCGGAEVKEINRKWEGSWGFSKGGNGQHAIDGPGAGGLPFNIGSKGSWDSFDDFWNFAKRFRKLPDGRLAKE